MGVKGSRAEEKSSSCVRRGLRVTAPATLCLLPAAFHLTITPSPAQPAQHSTASQPPTRMQTSLHVQRCRHAFSGGANRKFAAAARRAGAAARRTAVRAAPVTGQHTVEDALRDEALAHFFRWARHAHSRTPASHPAQTTQAGAAAAHDAHHGGVNNCVQYVSTQDGQRFILRVYNNGNKTSKVVTEHAILAQLAAQQAELSFRVPTALPCLTTGEPFVVLSSGAAACVFEVIPGSLAKTTSPLEVGRATGELVAAMGRVALDHVPPVPPYFKVFDVHHAINGQPDKFYAEVAANPAFEACRESIDYMVEQIKAMEPLLDTLAQAGAASSSGSDSSSAGPAAAAGLPMQLIHGDLHFDNVLVLEDDRVSGLLDFEFCAFDIRAMELAVALSKYVGEAEPLPLITQFVSGYVQHGRLTPQEVEALPDLINLRVFSNAIYFTGRALAGEDGIESLTTRADSYAQRVRWVNANRGAIVEAVQAQMRQLATAAA